MIFESRQDINAALKAEHVTLPWLDWSHAPSLVVGHVLVPEVDDFEGTELLARHLVKHATEQ